MEPTLKAPGYMHLKLRYDGPVSNFAFKVNSRRYITGHWKHILSMAGKAPDGELMYDLVAHITLAARSWWKPCKMPDGQGLTLVHFSAQPKPFWSHLPVSPCQSAQLP
jgi:hypothetical protein